MIALIFAVAMLHNDTSTPEAAALHSVSFNAHPVAVRVNRTGEFATVLTRGGKIENRPIYGAILVERFAFGWQSLELLDVDCLINFHALTASQKVALMRGMPRPRHDPRCYGKSGVGDVGSASDIAVVRRQMAYAFVPAVTISRSWAFGGWYGNGGGFALFHKRSGIWARVTAGGGALDFDGVRAYGVPARDACNFHLLNATC